MMDATRKSKSERPDPHGVATDDRDVSTRAGSDAAVRVVPRWPGMRLSTGLMLVVAMLALATVPGCEGCRKDPTAKKKDEKDKKKKKKKKPKPNFVADRRLKIQPHDDTSLGDTLKWGHWSGVTQQMKANNFHFQGELQSASVDRTGAPLMLERTGYRMTTVRPASLPKGQQKHFEMTYFVPRRKDREKQRVSLQYQLRGRNGGREVLRRRGEFAPMHAHQYCLVVLARTADSYGYLKTLDSIAPPTDDFDREEGLDLYYRVLLPKIVRRVPLPSHALAWTTIACVVWDDVDPAKLTPAQQGAMLDWLHWGGQLIVSGPGSLDSLKGSFLNDYLPAESDKSVKLDAQAVAEINEHFSIPGGPPGKEVHGMLQVVPDKPLNGVKLEIHPAARFVPDTGRLLAERRVGRGRIVVTAFSLTDRRIVNWPSFDGFFNACLLRHPRRQFKRGESDVLLVDWADPELKRLDPRLISNLRYFSRDASHFSSTRATDNRPVSWAPPDPYAGFQSSSQSGVAGWNDFNGTADAARDALKGAAGIDVPEASFVITVLGVYLVFLVPINWGFFRLIGRVEWAWIAAPLIAVVGAGVVIKLAQLDIGFLRSRTEIGVLELQGGHERGHLTRYSALYSSLSTGYDLYFDDESAQIQPFAADPNVDQSSSRSVTFHRDRRVSLRGFFVRSNSTGMVHSEQMLDLGGGLKLTGDRIGRNVQIANETDLTLEGVGILRRTGDGSRGPAIEVAWIGTLNPETAAPVEFAPAGDPNLLAAQWDDYPETAAEPPAGQLSLRGLLELAQDPKRLGVGDVRLIGFTKEQPSGMSIRPRASQVDFRTLIVAHLRYGALPPPQPDKNTRREMAVDDRDEPLTPQPDQNTRREVAAENGNG